MQFHRSAAMLVLFAMTTTVGVLAQSSSSSEGVPQANTGQQSTGAASVQARVRERRLKRREAALHDTYDNSYDFTFGSGFMRVKPGPGASGSGGLQNLNEYLWDVSVSRYFSRKTSFVLDARGNYGTAYLGNNQYDVVKPAISQYMVMCGPSYRFVLQPRWSVSGRVMGGWAYGNFLSDAGGYTAGELGLYPDGSAFAVSAGLPVEVNLTPTLALRATPEYVLTSFGSSMQNNVGITAGIVVRFGKK
jgi:hypothetical protein